MKHFAPHALILLVFAAWAGGVLPEKPYLILFLAGHLSVPIWSAILSRRHARKRALFLGPGSVIAAHAILIVIVFLVASGGHPEDSWLAMMVLAAWLLALAAYTGYCLVTFALIARFKRS
ncbi:MAG: hypothetical protein ACTHU0_35080 [Kofleriaceae bacterium]